MKIVLYTNRNVGLISLSYIKALGHEILLVTEDDEVRELAKTLGVKEVGLTDELFFDLYLVVHGRKIIPTDYLKTGKFVNIHPTNYSGHNPVLKYINNGDETATLKAHYMTEVVDEGEVVWQILFRTGVCHTYSDFYNIALRHYFRLIELVLKEVNK